MLNGLPLTLGQSSKSLPLLQRPRTNVMIFAQLFLLYVISFFLLVTPLLPFHFYFSQSQDMPGSLVSGPLLGSFPLPRVPFHFPLYLVKSSSLFISRSKCDQLRTLFSDIQTFRSPCFMVSYLPGHFFVVALLRLWVHEGIGHVRFCFLLKLLHSGWNRTGVQQFLEG